MKQVIFSIMFNYTIWQLGILTIAISVYHSLYHCSSDPSWTGVNFANIFRLGNCSRGLPFQWSMPCLELCITDGHWSMSLFRTAVLICFIVSLQHCSSDLSRTAAYFSGWAFAEAYPSQAATKKAFLLWGDPAEYDQPRVANS